MFFISPAYAQAAGGGLQDALGGIAPLLLMLPIFYFLLIRPQQQKAKQHQEMVNKIRRGDGVVLAGGIIGKVNRVRDDDPIMDVEIAKGTIIQVVRAYCRIQDDTNDAPEYVIAELMTDVGATYHPAVLHALSEVVGATSTVNAGNRHLPAFSSR